MVHISSTIKHTPRLPCKRVSQLILGTDYELSVSFIGSQRARTLNQKTRAKDYVPNVLSFPLTDTCGEIYICPQAAAREAADFGLSQQGYLTYLLIHGCLHLAGYEHGRAMDAQEDFYRTHFKLR